MEKKRYIHPSIAVHPMCTTRKLCISSAGMRVESIHNDAVSDTNFSYGGAGGDEEAR